jgi:hypothetical protein
MDKPCAQVGLDTRGDQRLVCPDGKDQRPDPLAAAIVGPKTAGQLAAALGTTLEAASAWLAEGLRAAGVLLREAGGQRTCWLPGVGTFALYLDRPGRPPASDRRPARPAAPRAGDPRQAPGAHARAAAAACTGHGAGPTYEGPSMSVKDELHHLVDQLHEDTSS